MACEVVQDESTSAAVTLLPTVTSSSSTSTARTTINNPSATTTTTTSINNPSTSISISSSPHSNPYTLISTINSPYTSTSRRLASLWRPGGFTCLERQLQRHRLPRQRPAMDLLSRYLRHPQDPCTDQQLSERTPSLLMLRRQGRTPWQDGLSLSTNIGRNQSLTDDALRLAQHRWRLVLNIARALDEDQQLE